MLVTGAALPAAAAAPTHNVVVLPFSGPGGSEVRRGVLLALRGQVSFTPAQKFLGRLKVVGEEMGTRQALVTVCTELEVDAVVRGVLMRHKNRSYTATVSVLDGGSGKVLGRRATTVRSARRLRQAGLAIGKKLMPLISKARFLEQPAPVAVVAPPPKPAPPPPTARLKPRPKKGLPSWGLFDLSLSMGFAIRNYTQQGNNPALDRSYDGSPYPEFTLALELYPGAPFTRGFLRNLGLRVSYSHHMSISTSFPSGTTEQPVDTSSQELLLDLMVRWPILDSATTPVLKFFAGGGLRDFSLAPNDVLPGMSYSFIHIGLAALVPIMTPLFHVHAGADIRPLLGVGQEAVDALGASSGAFAFAVGGGVGGRAPFGLTYGLTFEYQHYSSRFDGRRDAPPGHARVIRTDPTTGTESYIRLMGTVGYSL